MNRVSDTCAPSDVAAWVERCGDELYRYARARLGSREDAEDAVQETLLAAIRTAGEFDGIDVAHRDPAS